ncbi:location of vulva defective 1 isoform X2 [Octopus sinensis]|uniref:Location of vulva defective 1 isoform X2 n=1 Tax=Octopus sinensis TaxID=2607531 RepID=A0A6P7STN6_9MOLL|nr:location of vulva defective 1 isoform X2 [Octopus sinensis]
MANLHQHHQHLPFPPETKIPSDITGTPNLGTITAATTTITTTTTTTAAMSVAATTGTICTAAAGTLSTTATTAITAPTTTTTTVTSGKQQTSIFPVDHNFYSEPQNCWDSIERFKEMQTNFNEAGTCLVDAFANSLKNTTYEHFSHDCSMVLGDIFNNNTLLLTQINELESLLGSLLTNISVLNKDEYQNSQNQTMAKCVVLFLKIQYDYHRHCSEAIAAFLQRITQQTNPDVLSLLVALNLTAVKFPQSSTGTAIPLSQMKNTTADKSKTVLQTSEMSAAPPLQCLGNIANLQNSGSVMKSHEVLEAVQQHPSSCPALPYPSCPSISPYPPSSSSSSSSSVFTTPSLSSSTDLAFSLFTKTNSLYAPIGAAAGQSPQLSSNNPILTPVVNQTAATQTTTTAAAAAAQCPDPGAPWPKLNTKPTIRAIGKNEKGATAYTKSSSTKSNSQIASEEELDSVINLLSGSVNLSQQPTMHVPNQLQLSPLHQSSTTGTSNSMFSSLVSSPDMDDPQKFYKGNNAHRRSEGSLDLSGMASLVGGSNNGCIGGGGGSGGGGSSGGGGGNGGGGGGGVRSGGRNTWPHPGYHHRSSLPAGPLGSQNPLNYEQREDYSRMLHSNNSLDQRNHINDVYLPPVSQSQEVRSGLYSLPGSSHFISNPDWTFPDTKLNRTWPVSSISTGGGDTSSDEDDVPAQKEGLLRAPMASQSMDNLYDCKSTYTWPPKHPWARRSNLVHNSPELDCSESTQSISGTPSVGPPIHSCGPWSADPLHLPRNMWPTGIPSHTPNQNSGHQGYGALHLANRE